MTSSIPDEAKVNVKRYVETLLPRLIKECKFLLPSFSARTMRMLTRQSWFKPSLPPAAVNLLATRKSCTGQVLPSAKYRPTRLVVDAALRRIGKSRHGD